MAVGLGDKTISKDLSKEEKYQPKVIERYKGNADYRVECNFIYTEYGKDNITKTSFHNLIRNTTYVPEHHCEIKILQVYLIVQMQIRLILQKN